MKFLSLILRPLIFVLKLLAKIFTPVTYLFAKSNLELAKTFDKVEVENQLVPKKDEDGNWTFETDRDFKVLQLSDIHLGGGWITRKKDRMALNAVAAMVTAEKPDLVIFTGDMAYPVPIQSFTYNNKFSSQMLIDLMETLGVYWSVTFGNHDTEFYSLYSREQLAKMYHSSQHSYSIFEEGPKEIDGFCNQIIKVKNSKGITSRAFFLLDSHSYIENDFLGVQWKYDNIHENQIQWYKKNVLEIDHKNKEIDPNAKMFTSFAYFHIPLNEYVDAWKEYKANEYNDTENVKHFYGIAGEPHEKSFPGKYRDNFFDTMLELGSTKGTFVGHDHLNGFSVEYKGIRLTYSKTIDYLAYIGIHRKGSHRGCTWLKLADDGEFCIKCEGYYQDKYVSKLPKESVIMDDFYPNKKK